MIPIPLPTLLQRGRRCAGIAAFALVAVWTSSRPASAQSLPGWDSEVSRARGQALKDEVPLVVLFVQEGCEDCAEMKATLRTTRGRDFFSSGRRSLVTIQEHPGTVREFRIDRTPTLIVLKPSPDGMREVFRQEGSMSRGQLDRVDRSVRSIVAIAHPAPAPAPVAPAEPVRPWGWSLRGAPVDPATTTSAVSGELTSNTAAVSAAPAVSPTGAAAGASDVQAATTGDDTPTTR